MTDSWLIYAIFGVLVLLLPWTVEKSDRYFIVTDGDGQQLAYVYFEDEPGR